MFLFSLDRPPWRGGLGYKEGETVNGVERGRVVLLSRSLSVFLDERGERVHYDSGFVSIAVACRKVFGLCSCVFVRTETTRGWVCTMEDGLLLLQSLSR